jgi:hypothetical protein
MTPVRPAATRRGDLAVSAAVSVAAFAITIVFFAPRFMFWPWLDLDPATTLPPELNRAVDTLRQLDNPFVRITSPINRVIAWRLLFPVLGHYLHLPPWAFLSLPALGCLLVLGYVAYLVRRESVPWWTALAACVLSATTSWFFVSTGWLAYFDSWCLLGMLVAAFARSKIATAMACLLTPWVDERFVLALPLVVFVRCIVLGGIEGPYSARLLSEGFRYFCLIAPYCVIRLVALAATHDEGSAAHLRSHLVTGRKLQEIADGMWFGLRGLWLFVAVVPGLLLKKGRAAPAVVFLVAVAATLAANVAIARDVSRAAWTVVPAAVLGILLLVRARPALAAWLLAAALAFNLLSPARHVIEEWDDPIPICSLRVEYRRLMHPPRDVAFLHMGRAQQNAARQNWPTAIGEIDEALRLDPTSAAVHLTRALILSNHGQVNDAAASFDAAVRLAPDRTEAYRYRAAFHRMNSQLEEAAQDLQAAVDRSSVGSSERAALERELASVRLEQGIR